MGRCHISERDVHEIGGWYILKSAMVSIWQDVLVAQKKRNRNTAGVCSQNVCKKKNIGMET